MRRCTPVQSFVIVFVGCALAFAACGRATTSNTASSTPSSSPTAVTPSACPPSSVGPTPRSTSVFVYDSTRQNLVLFGGLGSQFFADTWLLGGTCWQQTATPIAPSARSTAAAAFDPITKSTIVYGGRGPSDTWLADTWTFDGAAWSQVQLATNPTLRFAMGAFDTKIGKMVVVGLTNDYSSTETWTWDGAWSRIATTSSPPPRASAGFAYDPVSQRAILFGGRSPDLTFLNDTWAFDGVNWTDVAPSTSPPARQNLHIANISQGLVLFGGDAHGATLTDTWTWNGDTWQRLATPNSPAVGWGVAGMASRNGQPVVIAYASSNAQASTYMLQSQDWAAS